MRFTTLKLARAHKALLVLFQLLLFFGAGLVQDHFVVLYYLLGDQLKDQVHLVVVLGYWNGHSILVNHLLSVLHGFLGVVSKILVIAFSDFHDLVGVKSQGLLRTLLLLDFPIFFK